MPIDDLLHQLEPLQQRIVRLIHLDGLSPDAAAQVAAVERVVIGRQPLQTLFDLAVCSKDSMSPPRSWAA